MSVLLRFVKSRVLDGGVGWVSGGRLERSKVSLDFLEADDDDREGSGVVSMVAACVDAVASRREYFEEVCFREECFVTRR